MAELPFIPETITVHLGAPSAPAENVSVSFPDYIKNVASSEIYPTWPEEAITANIYAQISYALNRIYTEYYRSQGYDFDITNSTALDQSFVSGRDYFENISQLVDEIFNDYIRRDGNVEPLFAQYCNGTTTTCAGMSQWGSVDLANQGFSPIEILRYYYGDNIELVEDAPVEGITSSVPFRALRVGSAGNDVQSIQTRLNRIAVNYPSIDKISEPDGIFGVGTENSVREFQRIFNLTPDGIVGKATWFKIQSIYNGVKRLNSLESEGLTYTDISRQFPEVLQEGDSGDGVTIIQYFLSYVAQYNDYIPQIEVTGYYGPETTAAVRAYQESAGLDPDGIMGEITYYSLYDQYLGILESLPPEAFVVQARPYPGDPLILGMQGDEVTALQNYLNFISDTYTTIPKIEVSGVYGTSTRDAVEEFQRLNGIAVTGVTAAATWDAIASLYDDLRAGELVQTGQYPGYEIGGEA